MRWSVLARCSLKALFLLGLQVASNCTTDLPAIWLGHHLVAVVVVRAWPRLKGGLPRGWEERECLMHGLFLAL